jgi:NAD(P)-dependent dehydrogenase (short-subunit alcohol dehydrogenase family)
MADLKGKVGIVTGGGTGIGRATALAMARAGAALVIGNRDAGGEEVVALIRQAGGRAVFHPTDVSKPADVKALVERAVREFMTKREIWPRSVNSASFSSAVRAGGLLAASTSSASRAHHARASRSGRPCARGSPLTPRPPWR